VDDVGFDVTRLVDLDLTSGIKGALIKCLDAGIDVFIRRPQTVNVWALPKDFHKSTGLYEKLKESNFREPLFNILNFEKSHRIKSESPSLSLSPSIIAGDVLLLQLSIADIKELIALKNLNVIAFQNIYRLNTKGCFRLIDTVVAEQYFPESFMPENYYSFNTKRINVNFDCDSNDFSFISCDKNKVSIDEFNDPLNQRTPIDIELKDCFVSSEVAGMLTECRVQDIPQNTTYAVPEDCRHSSKLNELAVLGHRFYKDKTLQPPKNMAKYIEDKLSIGKKEASAAAFFINPEPNGDMNDEYKGVAQFKHLIEVYKEFYVGGALREEKITKGINQRIKNTFDSSYGYENEKCRYAVKLIAPDA
jgi:hypothetical protein